MLILPLLLCLAGPGWGVSVSYENGPCKTYHSPLGQVANSTGSSLACTAEWGGIHTCMGTRNEHGDGSEGVVAFCTRDDALWCLEHGSPHTWHTGGHGLGLGDQLFDEGPTYTGCTGATLALGGEGDTTPNVQYHCLQRDACMQPMGEHSTFSATSYDTSTGNVAGHQRHQACGATHNGDSGVGRNDHQLAGCNSAFGTTAGQFLGPKNRKVSADNYSPYCQHEEDDFINRTPYSLSRHHYYDHSTSEPENPVGSDPGLSKVTRTNNTSTINYNDSYDCEHHHYQHHIAHYDTYQHCHAYSHVHDYNDHRHEYYYRSLRYTCGFWPNTGPLSGPQRHAALLGQATSKGTKLTATLTIYNTTFAANASDLLDIRDHNGTSCCLGFIMRMKTMSI